jgi:hypothetical protein
LAGVADAQTGQTITATAMMKMGSGVDASAPVRIEINRLSTEHERDEVLAALRQGGTAGVSDLLRTRDPLGSVQVGTVKTPIKFAFARTTADGQLITAVTGSPIMFIGAGLPGAPPNTGYDLGMVMVEVSSSGPGRGEIVPAAKVRLDEQGAIVTDEYSREVVRLSNVIGK